MKATEQYDRWLNGLAPAIVKYASISEDNSYQKRNASVDAHREIFCLVRDDKIPFDEVNKKLIMHKLVDEVFKALESYRDDEGKE